MSVEASQQTPDRTDPPLAADEATTLLAFLDYHRDTLRLKVASLDAEQLRRTTAASQLTLGGLVKHLALVETSWLHCRFLGNEYPEPWASVDWDADEDWDFHSAGEDSPEDLIALLDESLRRSDAVIATALADGAGLDQRSVVASRKPGEGTFSLRWIVVHLIEEYARHNGHADLLRESIDGRTGE